MRHTDILFFTLVDTVLHKLCSDITASTENL